VHYQASTAIQQVPKKGLILAPAGVSLVSTEAKHRCNKALVFASQQLAKCDDLPADTVCLEQKSAW